MKGFTKLSIQIAIMSGSMMALSFITDTDFWIKYFNYYSEVRCNGNCPKDGVGHYHWNYRGWVYTLTGFAYFFISVAKIIVSTNEEDFEI